LFPLSTGVGGAENATLTFMVGADASYFEAAKPILSLMGKNIVHCGPNGTGQVRGSAGLRRASALTLAQFFFNRSPSAGRQDL
jgi:hypothetical protein